jgi:uncharacterized cupin superfamily protein
MTVSLAHRDDCEQSGNWRLVRRTLGVKSFGVNLVDIRPREQIPEHDESERDQEELFCVATGNPPLVIDGEAHQASAGTFARIDPEHSRTVRNDGDEAASVLIVSAPTSSGFVPMEWA